MESQYALIGVKLNQAMDKNKQLRLKIDKMRKERMVFDMIYRDLESNYKAAKINFVKVISS